MKIWILVAIALVLLVVAMRSEMFEATASIKAPPYDADAKIRMFEAANTADQTILRAKAETEAPSEPNPVIREKKVQEIAGGYLAPAIGDFFTAKFKPATVPITAAEVDAFIDSRPASEFKEIERRVLKTYFIGQSGIGTSQASGYASVLASMNQGPGYLVTGATAAAPGAPVPAAPGTPAAPGAPAAPGTPAAPGAPATPAGGTSTQGTPTATGGSTSSLSVTSKPSVMNSLFGPAFTSFGEPSPTGSQGDSSKFTSYPQVLGGVASPSKLVPGAGVVAPGRGSANLPSDESLGATEKSQFLPFSRTPGDMELIPDPYRVSQTFSTANYASKTEPVPFLADFSAFQK